MIKPDYLGDAVYVSEWLGDGGIMLTTGHHDVNQAQHVIYLEPSVLAALDHYRQRMKEEANNGKA